MEAICAYSSHRRIILKIWHSVIHVTLLDDNDSDWRPSTYIRKHDSQLMVWMDECAFWNTNFDCVELSFHQIWYVLADWIKCISVSCSLVNQLLFGWFKLVLYHLSDANWLLQLLLLKSGFFLIGVIRLVHYLSQNHLLGKERALKLVVDAGTGTTAVGLALGALCLGCVLCIFYFLLVKWINDCNSLLCYESSEAHYGCLVIASVASCQASLGGNCRDAGWYNGWLQTARETLGFWFQEVL